MRGICLATAVLCGFFAAGSESPDDAKLAEMRSAANKSYNDVVKPFFTKYCMNCHSEEKKKTKGGVTFLYASKAPANPGFRRLWARASAQIHSHDMPPEEEKAQPTAEERKAVLDWVAGLKYMSPKDPGQYVIRRLSKAEYANTLHDLFGVERDVANELPEEVFGAGYANSISSLLMEQYLSIANDVLKKSLGPVTAPPNALEMQLFGSDEHIATREVARALARKMFRRPPSENEIDVLMKVYALATSNGKTHREALRQILKATLVSPQFLFLTPDAGRTPSPEKQEIVALDDYQLASRLSYFLWATMPDAELSALADAGKLRDPKVLAAQARRLLKDPRSRALFDGFGAQWLGLDKLAGKTFDAEKFPQMTPALRAAMYDEARLLFESIVREDRSVASFIDCDYSYLNDTLATTIYGMKVNGAEPRKVSLNNPNRGGILTLPGVLAVNAFPNRTAPVNRGVWVLEQVLGEDVPPPPANVPPLDKQDKEKIAGMTLRQRTELHRSNPTCASCHKILDPIGFGLENFDAIGRWRDKDDSGLPIDATGELPGEKRFKTPRELKQILSARTGDLSHNLTARMLAYALCRQLDGYDEIVVDRLSEKIAKDGYRMQTLITSIVTSYPFMNRRVEQPAPPPPPPKKAEEPAKKSDNPAKKDAAEKKKDAGEKKKEK